MSVSRSRRVLRILKWAGVASCLILAVAWPLSVGRFIGYFGNLGNVLVAAGSVAFIDGAAFPPIGFAWLSSPTPEWLGEFIFEVDIAIISVPIWFALLISIPVTYVLFRLDRKRIPPGHCQRCGYDLTGNVSGVCSECGVGVVSGEGEP